MNFVTRDLGKIVENVVPQGRQGLPNLVSTKQVGNRIPYPSTFISNTLFKILESWRSKRVLDPQTADDVLSSLDTRSALAELAVQSSSDQDISLPRNEIFKRIEEDRECHKRLRERRWVQPITHNPSSHHPPQLASFMPLTHPGDGEEELTIDIEFENEWETTSDWNEDDEEAAAEELSLCFPAEGEGPIDFS